MAYPTVVLTIMTIGVAVLGLSRLRIGRGS